jgi:D-glycero-D-manno-heptose 1,7-bisphosphate phosphatase
MVRAVFLDRDGTINRAFVRDGKPYPPATLSEFELLPDAADACRLLKSAGFLLVVATNQPDVGRGTVKREAVEEIHTFLAAQLPIDRIEVCYDSGDTPSECRKPRPGMLLGAARDLDIDLKASWMIGDRWRDIDCGHAAGCRTVFIDNGYAEELRATPDVRVTTILEAAQRICCEI